MATSFITLIPLFKHYDVWWSTDQFQSPGDSVDCILTLMESTRAVKEKDCKRTNGEKRMCEWAKKEKKKDVHVTESKRARAYRRKGRSFLGCWHTQSHSLQHRLWPKQLFRSDSLALKCKTKSMKQAQGVWDGSHPPEELPFQYNYANHDLTTPLGIEKNKKRVTAGTESGNKKGQRRSW